MINEREKVSQGTFQCSKNTPDIKVSGCNLKWWLIKVEQWLKQKEAVIENESHLKRHSESNRRGVLKQLHFRKVIKA